MGITQDFLNVNPWFKTSNLKGLDKRNIIAKIGGLYLNLVKNGGHSKFQKV